MNCPRWGCSKQIGGSQATRTFCAVPYPERFAPAYGGYCAWAVSQGYLAKGDPQHWAIRDGRLLLNYDESVQNRWLKDTESLIRQADANWPKVLE